MSFIFKNLDTSRPNLRVGEILDSMLQNECKTVKALWDQNISGSGSYQSGSLIVDYSGSDIYSLQLQYRNLEYMDRNNIQGEERKRGILCKQFFDSLYSIATQLYMPDLVSTFPNIFESQVIDDFQSVVTLEERKNVGTYSTSYSLVLRRTGSTATIGSLPFFQSINLASDSSFNSRDEWFKFGGLASIGFKYWGDIERTLEDVRTGSAYVGVTIIPQVRTYDNERVCIGHTLNLRFGAYGNAFSGIFRDSSVTPENVEHRNDLPDDQNTYPGGGNDENNYPQDTDEGLNSSGNGTFDNTNDPLDFPGLPLWDATSTGFISMYRPTIAEIIQLYGFLWDSDIATTLKKLFLEPMDAIISLAYFPVDPVVDSEKRHVTIGHVDTEISMDHVQKQFVDFDFGSVQLDEYYGAAWDYSPYTKVSIYLPYIGSQEIDVDDVMNSTLSLRYRVDLLSGMCVAMLKVERQRDGLNAVAYTWQGNCAMNVPVTAGSAREFINSIIQIGAMTGLALVQPAAGALVATQNSNTGGDFEINAGMGNNWVNPLMGTYSALNVMGQKVHVQRGGRVDANAGVISPQSAYLVINRPVSAIPKGWNEYAGYPSLKIKELSTQKGFTQVAYIKLNGLEATAEEITELDTILKGGVIL